MKAEKEIYTPETLSSYKLNLKFWIIVNVVLTTTLLVSYFVLFGAMQQLYTRTIAIQTSLNNYVTKYDETVWEIRSSNSSFKTPPLEIVKKRQKAE